MAVEYKIRADARQAKAEFDGLTNKQKRNEIQTQRLALAQRRLNLSTKKVTASELKFATATKVATAGMRNQRRVTTGLAATIGAFRNQILLVTFATAGLIAASKKFIDSASAMNEAQNLVTQTFGESAREVELFASKAAGAIGQTRGEALKLLGDLGSIAKGFGFTEKAAANFSQTALQLASDIGSLKFASTEEVLHAFRSAMVGQSEPMLRFGSDVRVAALEVVALEEGIINSKRALTNQEKAVAALAQVFRTNKDAIDDFAETQDEFATASKISAAKVRELVEDLGTKFLPAAAQAAIGLTILVDNLDLVKKAISEAFTFPIITERLGVDLVGKSKEIFQEVQSSLKENAQKARDDDSVFAPLLTFMARLVGVDDETKTVVKERTKTSLDELLALFKDAQTKFESAFDIGAGVEQAILNLGDGMRDVGDGLETSVLPPMEDMSNAMSDIAIDAEKFRIQMETARLTRFPHIPKISVELRRAQALSLNLANSFAQAVVHSDDLLQSLKQIAKVLAAKALAAFLVSAVTPISFGKAFFGFQHGGQFQVGGSGSPDSQLVAFRASPGETVTVTPPNQTTNNSTANITIAMPNVREIDEFTLRSEIIPKINELVQSGAVRLTASDIA